MFTLRPFQIKFGKLDTLGVVQVSKTRRAKNYVASAWYSVDDGISIKAEGYKSDAQTEYFMIQAINDLFQPQLEDHYEALEKHLKKNAKVMPGITLVPEEVYRWKNKDGSIKSSHHPSYVSLNQNVTAEQFNLFLKGIKGEFKLGL